MARIRSIKPEFFASEDVSALPLRARLTWIGLWLHCDDHGRTKDKAQLIKAQIWPLDNVSLRDVEEDLRALAGGGRIVRYIAGGVPLLAVTNWHFHQSINRPGRPKFAAPPVSMRTPDPGEPGHCALCWTHFLAHGGLTEPSPPVDNSNVDVSAGHSPNSGSTEDSLSTHGGLTPGGEGKGEERRGDACASARPPERCPQHLHTPTTNPCRACGDTRLAGIAWDQEQIRAQSDRDRADARQRAADTAAAVANCALCDDAGYVGRQLCTHDPGAADRAARGSALARAALAARTPPAPPPPDERAAG